jgi:hypothetical protein
LPAWIGGNDIPTYASHAGFKLVAVDLSTGWWDACTIESHEHHAANLVWTVPLLGSAFDSSLLSQQLGALPVSGPGTFDSDPVQAALLKLTAIKDVATMTSAYSLATLTAKNDQIADIVESSWLGLRSMTDEGQLPCFPECEVHVVRVSEALPHRYNFCRAFLRLEDDPSLYDKQPPSDATNLAFASSLELFTDTMFGLEAYLAPVFLAASPWMWGFGGIRRGGVVVYSFGKAISGRSDLPTELLQLHGPKGSQQTGPPMSDVTPEAIAAALGWWTKRLNRLFSVITNPAHYGDRNGRYQPRRQFEVLLGIEQLFRHVGSILGQVRDQNARRMLFFSAFDTLAGLGGLGLRESFELEKAESALAFVEGAMSREEGAILLPNARRAVEGLRAVQDGFFLPSRVTDTGVRIPGPKGEQTISKSSAAAFWLLALRNATHGFRAKRSGNWARGEVLLTAHNGTIPEGLPLLAYLYLLQLLADPSRADRFVWSAATSVTNASQAP